MLIITLNNSYCCSVCFCRWYFSRNLIKICPEKPWYQCTQWAQHLNQLAETGDSIDFFVCHNFNLFTRSFCHYCFESYSTRHIYCSVVIFVLVFLVISRPDAWFGRIDRFNAMQWILAGIQNTQYSLSD